MAISKALIIGGILIFNNQIKTNGSIFKATLCMRNNLFY